MLGLQRQHSPLLEDIFPSEFHVNLLMAGCGITGESLGI